MNTGPLKMSRVYIMIPDLIHPPDPTGDVLYRLLSLHDHEGWVLQSEP